MSILLATGCLSLQAAEPGAAPIDSVLRLLPPLDGEASGKTVIEVLSIAPGIRTIVFSVDGVEVSRLKGPPWRAKIKLASPAREQSIEAKALDQENRILGTDEITVNRRLRRFKVAILELGSSPELRVRAEITTPEGATLRRVVVSINNEELASLSPQEVPDGKLERVFDYPARAAGDFVRVAATLEDGSVVEDAQLLSRSGFRQELDVQLVQLQLMVTNKQGYPVRGLRREHFRIREEGTWREVADLFVADEVALLLGLAIDTSGSMRRIWQETQEAASSFLEETLTDSDQGFLVAFDTQVRLVEPRTRDTGRLRESFELLVPGGGTALFDSIVFSLLQFDRQQGRRGLVVLTDGVDSNSTVDPQRVVEFGQKLGVPLYILALEGGGRGPGGGRGSLGGAAALDPTVGSLKLLTDATGGRLYRVRTLEHIQRAFSQINRALRNQYVLTYYTDNPPEPAEPPEVLVDVPDFKKLKVKAVFGADTID